MRFEFATASRILFGPGVAGEVDRIAAEFGSRPLVITGRNPGRVQTLLERLQDQNLNPSTFAVQGEPDISTINSALSKARSSGCDLVVGIGGGSVLDAGKAVAAMLANEGELTDYLEVVGRGKSPSKPSVPFIAMPTTAGTGSEVTRNAVVACPEQRVKVSIRGVHMLPRVAIVDPELTFDLPAAITASTGLDALTQLIEPFVSIRANPMVDALCKEGILRVARSLRTACTNGRDAGAREDMALASLFGGLALANAGLGAVHGFAGPIGGMFPAPHGAVCAALLPHVMEANLEALRLRDPQSAALERYAQVARWLTGDSQAKVTTGVEWVRKLVSELRIPGLSAYGLSRVDIAEVVEKSTRASSMKANPIPLTREELVRVVEQAL